MNKDAQGRWKVGMSNIKLKMRVIMVLIGFAPLLAAKLLLPDAPGTWLVGGVGLIVWDGLLRLIFGVWFKCFFLPMWVWGAFFAAGGLFDF